MAPALGLAVGPYRLEELVSSDALGLVYLARDRASDRSVLVRFLPRLAGDPAAMRRFQIEVPAIARLEHPNIVGIERWGDSDGTPYVVSGEPAGARLSDLLAGGRRPDRVQALRMLRDLAAALDHAHLFGVVHGDLEPAAVVVGRDGVARLRDFGLALLLNASPVPGSGGVRHGSPAHAAPERAQAGAVGPAADVYAFAAMAYELLTGWPPFQGETPQELLSAHVFSEPPSPSRRAPDLPAAADAPLLRGLAKDPGRRWQTAGAMMDALERALSGAPAASAPRAPSARARGAELRSFLDRMPRLALWIGLGGLAGLVLVLGVVLAGHTFRPAPTLTLSRDTARPGDAVLVAGRNLPPGQPGTVVLEGRPGSLARFTADGAGAFAAEITVPLDASGSRKVEACWGGSCPIGQVLRVLAVPTPSPAATPLVVPTPQPTASPVAPAISLNKLAPRRRENVRVEGRGFDPAQQYQVVLVEDARQWVLRPPTSPDRNGSFTASVQIPADAHRGFGLVLACVYATDGPTTTCAQQPVLIAS